MTLFCERRICALDSDWQLQGVGVAEAQTCERLRVVVLRLISAAPYVVEVMAASAYEYAYRGRWQREQEANCFNQHDSG